MTIGTTKTAITTNGPAPDVPIHARRVKIAPAIAGPAARRRSPQYRRDCLVRRGAIAPRQPYPLLEHIFTIWYTVSCNPLDRGHSGLIEGAKAWTTGLR